jgi:hypothetical protein
MINGGGSKDHQLMQMGEQLAQKDAAIADHAATIAEQAARIADLEEQLRLSRSTPAAPRRQSAQHELDAQAKTAAKAAHESAFENSLEPELRGWMHEAPSSVSAEIQADKARALELEGTPAGLAELAVLAPNMVMRMRHSAGVFLSIEELRRLGRIIEAGNKLYFGIYHGVLDMVRSNDGYADFCAALNAVACDTERFPQPTPGLLTIYGAAAEALPLFGAVLQEVTRRVAAGAADAEPKMRVAPLKHVFRVLQKHALRVDGGAPTHFETACDIVRGSIVCGSMGELLRVLRALLALQAEGRIVIVRIKDRFAHPTAAGWADAMINFVCLGGGCAAAGHVCEVQLVHATMLKARKEFGGHNAYAAFREAAELLECAVGGFLVKQLSAAMEPLLATVACQHCSFINAAGCTLCEMCEQQLSAAMEPLLATVACQHCTFINAAGCTLCEICEQQLGTAMGPPLAAGDTDDGGAIKERAVVAWGRLVRARMGVPVGSDAAEAAAAACAAVASRFGAADEFDGTKKFEEDSTDADVTAWLGKSFLHCAGLTMVNLENCYKLTDGGIGELARHCAGLTTANLSCCHKLTDGGLGELARHCAGLTTVDISFQGGTLVSSSRFTEGGIGDFKRQLPNCLVIYRQL